MWADGAWALDVDGCTLRARPKRLQHRPCIWVHHQPKLPHPCLHHFRPREPAFPSMAPSELKEACPGGRLMVRHFCEFMAHSRLETGDYDGSSLHD